MLLLILNACLFSFFILTYRERYSNKNGYLLSFLFVILLYLHSCIDPDTMEDLPDYYDNFNNWAKMHLSEILVSYRKNEYIFLILNWLVSLFSNKFIVFMIVESFLIIICYYIWSFKYSPNILLSLLLMLLLTFNQSIFVLRQHLAIAIILLSYPYLINKKFIPYLFICTIAFFMHHASIIWFPVYFIYLVNDRKMLILLFICLIFISSYVVTNVEVFNEGMDLGYSSYISGDKVGNSNLVEFFINLIIFGMYLFALKKQALDEGLYKLLTIILFLSVVGSYVGTSISTLTRLLLYYRVCVVIAIPITITKINNSLIKWLYGIFIVAIFGYIAFFGSTSIYYLRMEYLKPPFEFILYAIMSFFAVRFLYRKIVQNKFSY